MNTDQIRQAFLDFYRGKDHKIRPSSPLIPPGDTTMLFTSAGMVPFKDNFFGTAVEPLDRAASCQKCLRETDLESVGRTARHHTFFEMLGNFSFGDYFKREAILWAWELVTQNLKMDPSRLHVSVFERDDEAHEIWHREVGVPEARIVRLGEKDNFWKMGDTGPCGPCSEIYVDLGPDRSCGKPGCAVGCSCDRYIEFYNLVFTQYDRQPDGSFKDLPKRNIDTGAGLERIASILQGKRTNFDTDLFQPVLTYTQELCGDIEYGYYADKDVSFRVIADHVRALTMSIADGIYPSNEGRGYVLRRILRRASRHGLNLGIRKPFLHSLVPAVVAKMKGGYPELMRAQEAIAKVVQAEEERFRSTLDGGMRILEGFLDKKRKGDLLTAEEAFKLFDTYGFPIDIAVDVAEERGFGVDRAGFEALMNRQKEQARAATSLGYAGDGGPSAFEAVLANHGKTRFTGYESGSGEGKVLAIVRDGEPVKEAAAGTACEIVLDATPFYGESGGQIGDTGRLAGAGVVAEIADAVKIEGVIVHKAKVLEGVVRFGDTLRGEIDAQRRDAIRRAHTATHLLHAALRAVLGEHVKQAGSKVEPDRLRFDFAHFEAVRPEQIEAVERLVAARAMADDAVECAERDLEEAMRDGATALFDEKYGDRVRVVTAGGFSKELCGGTHVERTGRVGLVKIASESALAAGVRRIEALTGALAVDHVLAAEAELRQVQRALACRRDEVGPAVARLQERVKELEKERDRSRLANVAQGAAELSRRAEKVGAVDFVAASLKGLSDAELREAVDVIAAKLGEEHLVVLASTVEGRVLFCGKASDRAVARKIHVGNLLKEASQLCGGGGGGRPNMAQAGGKDPARIPEALALVKARVAERAG